MNNLLAPHLRDALIHRPSSPTEATAATEFIGVPERRMTPTAVSGLGWPAGTGALKWSRH